MRIPIRANLGVVYLIIVLAIIAWAFFALHVTRRIYIEEISRNSQLVAEEMLKVSPDLHAAVVKRLGDIPIETISHENFKEQTQSAKAVIRTGEFTPFANIILVAGVVF